jgi:hypothetical protein
MTENAKSYPLAKDINGEPIEVPPEAVAWRVRRRSGKQGRPQSVFDPETGTPLEIDLDSEIDELRPCGPGGYRLDAIDGTGKLIAGITAYVEVPAIEAEPTQIETPTETAATLRELTGLLRESMMTNCRALEAMATAFGPVRPAEAPPQAPVYVTAAGQAVDDKDMAAKFMAFVPQLIQMIPMFVQAFKNGVASATGAPAATVPPTGGVS